MNIRIVIVPALLFLFGIAGGQSFVPPIDNLLVGQEYAAYGAVTAGKYHTGMDISRSGVPRFEQRTTNVKVARAGTVYKIFGLYRSGNNLRRWNSSTNTYDWIPSPIPYNQPGGDNHGLGICVIVYHSDLKLYSLYGHLDAVVSTLSINQSVFAGQVIGRLGNSYKEYLRKCNNYGSYAHNHQSLCVNTAPDAPAGTIIDYTYASNPGFSPHVHFEVKDRGVLSARRTDDEGSDWGYTSGNTSTNMPGHPNWFGYHDPNLFLNTTVELLLLPIPVEVLQFTLNVRSYPSTSPPSGSLNHIITTVAQRTDGRLPAFVATRRIGNQWYQIHLPNAETEGWSASGWVAGTIGSTQYSRENNSLPYVTVIAPSARVYSQPTTSSSTLVFVYGENALDRQKFVMFGSAPGWKQVYLPLKSSQPDGFILESALPVQLASFTATTLNGSSIRLNWTTLSEINNYGFYIHRHPQSDSTWYELPNSFVPGHGTTNEPQHYTYTDSTLPAPGRWWYRLKQVDLDGTIHFSDAISVNVVTTIAEGPLPSRFSLSQNHPNPFNPSTTIEFALPKSVHATLKVFDLLGREVATLVDENLEPGMHKREWNAQGVASGVYLYQLRAGEYVETKKLLLLR